MGRSIRFALLTKVCRAEAIRRSHNAFKTWRNYTAVQRRDLLLKVCSTVSRHVLRHSDPFKVATLLREKQQMFRDLYRQDTSVTDTVLDIDFAMAISTVEGSALS